MRYFGRTIDPEFTDLAILVGPDVRWTERDYEDLRAYQPEVFLGYRVRLFTVRDVMEGRHRGWRPEKAVLLDEAYHRGGPRFEQEIRGAVMTGHFPKVEVWHVHVGEGIWRVV